MNWLLDIALIAVMVLIVVINTKRGCISLLSFLAPVISFASAALLGPQVGKLFVEGKILGKATELVKDLLTGVFGEAVQDGSQTVSAELPGALTRLLEKTEYSADSIVTKLTQGITFDEIAGQIAAPIAECVAAALGCVIVFIAAWLVVAIVKRILVLIFKLPILKQTNHLLGFVLGLVNAFAITWGLCVLLGIFVEFGVLGKYNEMAAVIAQSSVLFRFFCGLSLVDFINILPIK